MASSTSSSSSSASLASTNPTAFYAAGGGARSTPAAPTAAAQALVLPPGLPPDILYATTEFDFTATGELDEYELFHSQRRFAMFVPATGCLSVWDINDISGDFVWYATVDQFGDPMPPNLPHFEEVFDTIGANGERELRVLSQWRSPPDTVSSSQRTSTVEIFNLRGELLQSRAFVTSIGYNTVFLSPPLHGRRFLCCRLDDHTVSFVDANDLQCDIATLRFRELVFSTQWWRGDGVLLLGVLCRYDDPQTQPRAEELTLYSFDGATAERLVTLSRRALNDDSFPLRFDCFVLPGSPTRVLIWPVELEQPHHVYRVERQGGAWAAVREKSFSLADAGGLERSSVLELSPCEHFLDSEVTTAASKERGSLLSLNDVRAVRDGGEVELLTVDCEDGSPQTRWHNGACSYPPAGSVGGSAVYVGIGTEKADDGSQHRQLALGVPGRLTDFHVARADAAAARGLCFIGADRVVLELDGGDQCMFSLTYEQTEKQQQEIEAEALEQRTTHPQRGWFRGMKRPRIIYTCEIEEDEEFNLEYDEFLGREQRRNERRERERRAVRAAAGELTDEDEDENEKDNDNGEANGDEVQRQ